MTMMEEAIEHGGDGGAISQQFAPVVDGSVRGEQSTGALIASHHDLQQFLGGGDGQLAHTEIIDDENAIGQAAIQQGYRVLYRETHKLLDDLAEATIDGTRKEHMELLATVPLPRRA